MRCGLVSAILSFMTVLQRVSMVLRTPGSFANPVMWTSPVILKRKMAPGVPDIEGSTHGHDVIPVNSAVKYFKDRGYPDFTSFYKNIKAAAQPYLHIGSTKEIGANRIVFGESVNMVLDGLSKEEAQRRVMVIDSDLEGSTGLKVIHQKHPEVFVPSGIMERGNFSAAAGFGFERDKFGVFSTFSAFLEMVVSELTMARLNQCNVLCHFSHSGGGFVFGIHRIKQLMFCSLVDEVCGILSRNSLSNTDKDLVSFCCRWYVVISLCEPP